MANTEDLGRKALLRSIIDQQVQQGEYDNAATAVVELRKFNNP
jgi:Arc/MetJ-type ribon-helix-helix transcriptional regulator